MLYRSNFAQYFPYTRLAYWKYCTLALVAPVYGRHPVAAEFVTRPRC